ncbi:ferredoxin [Streptomyces poriticola]|uniref:ferredoxin n=1 Tax=Streptomyces poriticola TaxID=3120506 RepID=UPI002FCDE593
MRLVVDLNRCQGYAQCAFLAPEVFTLHGEEALLYDAVPDEYRREEVLRAAAACPVRAILIQDGPVAALDSDPDADSNPDSNPGHNPGRPTERGRP